MSLINFGVTTLMKCVMTCGSAELTMTCMPLTIKPEQRPELQRQQLFLSTSAGID